MFRYDLFPKYPIKKGRTEAFMDQRNLVFLPAKMKEMHGMPRVGRQEDHVHTEDIRNYLNGLYRFGIPYHEGFHYDVQKVGNKSIKKITFRCCVNGIVRAGESYINICPNDYIRP